MREGHTLPLCLALQHRHWDVAKYLLKRKCDVTKPQQWDVTPLRLAASTGAPEGKSEIEPLYTVQKVAQLPSVNDTFVLDTIRKLPILETNATHFLRALEAGSVPTNVFLRRVHNFALDMSWLPWPVLPKKRWPQVRFKEKRAVTALEHQAIVAAEHNPERRAFYELCWHLGGAQSDVAHLSAEDIDWQAKVVSFSRQKTGTASIIRFGEELERILLSLPRSGPLFPKLQPMREAHRATEFRRACRRLKISGITLHSYRYAWAERARSCGYPERFALEALGHQSKAVHRAYAKKAQVVIATLEEYKRERQPLPRSCRSRCPLSPKKPG